MTLGTTAHPPVRRIATRLSASRRVAASWLGIGLLVFLLGAGWAGAVPLMASPDEPSHVVRAAAVARGQLSGELGEAPSDALRPGAATTVQLPRDYAASVALPNCFAFQPEVPAACQQDVAPPDGSVVPVETFAGQYPPLYYALVGWPSLFLGAEAGIYAMRLVSAALAAGLLTWGAFRLRTSLGRATSPWVVALAITPMCLFFGATVNPQGLEIASAFSLWAACLALATDRRGPSGAMLVQAAVSGSVLINLRASSPFWALAIVAVAVVMAPPGRLREVFRHPWARWVVAITVAASATAVAWLLTHRDVVSTEGLFPQYRDLRESGLALTGHTYEYLLNMVGNFGWLDSPAPPLTFVSWFVVGGAVLVLALVVPSPRRQRLALVLVLLGVGTAPFVLQLPTAVDTGIIWQGRYALPVAVGIPVVAGVLLAGQVGPLATMVGRLGRVLVPILLVAHVAAFWWASRRYAEGLTGELFTISPDWSSPIGYLPGTALYAMVAATLAAAAWRSLHAVPSIDQT